MLDAAEITENTTPIDRRRHHRQRTFLHGKLVSPVQNRSGDCTIRNLSEVGAQLKLPEFAVFGDSDVVVVTKTGAAHQMSIVWRRGTEAGVRFAVSHDLNGGAPPQWVGVRNLWNASR